MILAVKNKRINIVVPPKQITDLHSVFVQGKHRLRLRSANNFTIAELKSECEKVGYSLTESDEGPALVSVINSSRLVPDIKRDLARFQGISGFQGQIDVLVLVLVQRTLKRSY